MASMLGVTNLGKARKKNEPITGRKQKYHLFSEWSGGKFCIMNKPWNMIRMEQRKKIVLSSKLYRRELENAITTQIMSTLGVFQPKENNW